MRRLLTRVFLDLPGDAINWGVRRQSLVFVLAALIASIVLAGVTGYWLFWRGSYLIAGLVIICFLWARNNAKGLEVDVDRTIDRLQVGQETETRLHLKSTSMFTKVWLEIEDETTMPGGGAKTVITLPAKSKRNWKVRGACRRRGLYSSGPLKVTTGDPFGLFHFTQRYGQKHKILVLPQPQELPYFWAPAAQLPGEGVVHQRTHYVTPNASGIREYHPGDSFNRIHWKSSARLGRMMVKTFEMDPTSNVWIVLDLHGKDQAGQGDESTEEYGVRIAASLAFKFAESNRMLGLMMDGEEKVLMEPSRGSQQYGRILEALAVASARGKTSLATLLQEEGRRLSRQTTVLIITPCVDEEWIASLSLVLQQGARAAVILLDQESFGKKDAGEPPTDALNAANVLTYLVRSQSDISLMLGPSGVVGDTAPERQKAGVR